MRSRHGRIGLRLFGLLLWILGMMVECDGRDELKLKEPIIIDPAEVDGINSSRVAVLPNPPLYPNGKLCETGQDPWTKNEMELLEKARKLAADTQSVKRKLKDTLSKEEQDYMDAQVKFLKNRCKSRHCSYSRKVLSGVCKSYCFLTKPLPYLILFMLLFSCSTLFQPLLRFTL